MCFKFWWEEKKRELDDRIRQLNYIIEENDDAELEETTWNVSIMRTYSSLCKVFMLFKESEQIGDG